MTSGQDRRFAKAQGIRGLQGVSPLHPLAAAGAPRHRHLEPPINRPAGNLHLILMRHVYVDELTAAAMWTTPGQRGIVLLIDHRRHGSEGLGSIILAAFSPRPLGIELGQTPRKGSGLAFAGATQLL